MHFPLRSVILGSGSDSILETTVGEDLLSQLSTPLGDAIQAFISTAYFLVLSSVLYHQFWF